MRRVVITEAAARADLAAIGLYLARRNPQAARRFLRAANRTIASLSSQPWIGELYTSFDPGLEGIRLCTVDRFRSYLIVYRAADDRVEILRVLHAARDVDQVLSEELRPE